MSHLLRHGRARVAVAVLFAGAPPLVAGVATAAPATPPAPARASSPEVVFQGGDRLGLWCRAEQAESAVTVPAETGLRMVNRTGRQAVLIVDGVPRGELSDGSSADLLFHHGPVMVVLRPVCALPVEAALRVEVGPPVDGSDPMAPSAARPGAAEGYRPGLDWSARPAVEVTGVKPVRDRGPTGLLALVAGVCVVGVSAGAIRAINAQRAHRSAVS